MTWLRCLAAATCAAALWSTPAQAAQKICVFDFIGASGDLFNMVRDYALSMQREGVFLELKGFNDEAAAVGLQRRGLVVEALELQEHAFALHAQGVVAHHVEEVT